MIGIYVYTNRLNGKRYIGKSTNIEAASENTVGMVKDE